jgi:hypothetical protein
VKFNTGTDWSAEAQAGVWWLVSVQNTSGSWGQPWFEAFKPTTELRDTATVLEAIQPTGLPVASLALVWLDTQEFWSFDHLARATAARASDSQNVEADLAILAAARRPTIADSALPNFPGGGWGAAAGFESDALDTALVLEAFAAAGQSSGMTEPVAFLLACQNADGGFGVRPGEESNLLVSLHAVLALGKFQSIGGVPASIQDGADFVVAHQDATGAVGASPGSETVPATALGSSVLELAGRSAAMALAETALTGQQLPNGSWNDDPYDTGLAVIALPEPDATLQLLLGVAFIAILARLHRGSRTKPPL